MEKYQAKFYRLLEAQEKENGICSFLSFKPVEKQQPSRPLITEVIEQLAYYMQLNTSTINKECEVQAKPMEELKQKRQT